MTDAGPDEEATPAGPLDRAKIADYLEQLTADREEAWQALVVAQHRFDGLTKAVAGLQKALEGTPPAEAEIQDPREISR